MAGRARGANAQAALAFASTYGEVPTEGFRKIAFASLSLGEEQGLIDSDLLGYGREPLEPDDDVINNDGDITVPVDMRLFGLWLKLLFGPPTTTQGKPATGSIAFAAQPTVNDTITVGGQAFTFKASITAANQILIGASLAETVRNAVWALNASEVAGVAAASYSTDLTANAIQITHDTIGTGGNAMTIAASVATPSGSTLAGGATTGPYNHVFTSGALALPDAAIEIAHPEQPSYHMNYGVLANSLAIALQRSGNLTAQIGLIAQGEVPVASSSEAGSVEELEVQRFSQFSGQVAFAGVPLGEVVSGQMNFSNNLDKAENIRSDGRIDGADPGMVSVTPQLVVRYKDRLLMDAATAQEAIDIAFGWRRSATESLTFRMEAVRLPRTRKPIPGPGSIQQTYPMQAHRPRAGGHALVVTLVNDVADYD